VASVAFLCAFWDPAPLFGQVVIGHPDWGLLAFSAVFLAVGATLVAIIINAEALTGSCPGEALVP